MRATASVQDYLGAIYDLAGSGRPVIGARLAEHMKVSAPAATEAIQRMAQAGYIRMNRAKGVALTGKGRALAEVMARRHRLLERWLTDVLGLDWTDAHEEAHRLEHALSPQVEERLAATLGMPGTCPHGNPIPGMTKPQRAAQFPLDRAQEGTSVVVVRIAEEAEPDRKLMDHLWRSEMRPGKKLKVLDVAPWAGTVTVKVEGRSVALGLAVAGKVWVRRSSVS